MAAIGRTLWVIPEGYIPEGSHGAGRALESHETACLLNAGTEDAHVRVTIFFATVFVCERPAAVACATGTAIVSAPSDAASFVLMRSRLRGEDERNV